MYTCNYSHTDKHTDDTETNNIIIKDTDIDSEDTERIPKLRKQWTPLYTHTQYMYIIHV